MVDFSKYGSPRTRLGLGAAALLAVGVAGGAGAVRLTRPAVEMAPVQPVAIASLPGRDGLVTVKGKVAEVFGDRFTVVDGSGKTMVDAGRDGPALTAGAPVTVQGRYDNGQLRASFLVDGNGRIDAVGPHGRPPHPPRGPAGPGGPGGPGARGPGGPDHDGPPPPAGCVPGQPGAAPGAPPPPPAAGAPVPAPGATPLPARR